MVQLHCHAPETLFTLPESDDPAAQRLLLGVVAETMPLLVPQAGAVIFALHVAVLDPLVQLHCHGPAPVGPVVVPIEQRLVDGAVVSVCPLLAPHVATRLAVQLCLPAPLVQSQFQELPALVTSELPEFDEHRLLLGAAAEVVPASPPHVGGVIFALQATVF